MGTSSAKSVPLVAVAHGSRDPRSAAVIHTVLQRVRSLRPDLDVRAAFLDLTAPSVPQVLDGVAADGYRHAVVVPLLLGSAYHARVDLPGLLARVHGLDIAVADVLGPDERLIAAVCDRIGDADGLALTAVGTSSPAANRRLKDVARRVGEASGRPTELCFATDITSVHRAVAKLGTGRIVVGPWMLAPGRLLDRVTAAVPDAVVADPVGDHPSLAEVIFDRYTSAIALPLPRSA